MIFNLNSVLFFSGTGGRGGGMSRLDVGDRLETRVKTASRHVTRAAHHRPKRGGGDVDHMMMWKNSFLSSTPRDKGTTSKHRNLISEYFFSGFPNLLAARPSQNQFDCLGLGFVLSTDKIETISLRSVASLR